MATLCTLCTGMPIFQTPSVQHLNSAAMYSAELEKNCVISKEAKFKQAKFPKTFCVLLYTKRQNFPPNSQNFLAMNFPNSTFFPSVLLYSGFLINSLSQDYSKEHNLATEIDTSYIARGLTLSRVLWNISSLSQHSLPIFIFSIFDHLKLIWLLLRIYPTDPNLQSVFCGSFK